ncbi:type II and III secretion system protein family protein [Acidimangrovimonas sediminis]|uniref:type II and III secretion system protein family protein n=1 Tax=Acidimangrovimonas sediminis TaxID=2056283 RepID=UPI000C7F799D|nr:type II and III secretion system protein family protein [Acidimangrovimonas sediminis]
MTAPRLQSAPDRSACRGAASLLARLALVAGLGLACLGALTPTPAAAQEIASGDKTSLSLKVGEAKFIKLDRPAKAVFLSNPNVADVTLQSASYIYIVGHAIGTTNLFVLGDDDKPLIQGKVQVDLDLGRIERAVTRALQSGAINLSTDQGAVFIDGTVDTEEDAKTADRIVTKLVGKAAVVVNNLTLTTPPQVNLQVTIAEVSRQVQQDLGISLSSSTASGRQSFSSPSSASGGFQLALSANGGNLNAVLDALATSGLATILSEPNLTARSGEQANFLAGGLIPVKVGATQDDTRVQFEKIGVELDFTPSVFKKNQIQIQLSTKVRQLDESNSTADNPAFAERSAQTTVELGSGQSFAIAGLFSATRQQSLSELPGIARIPILGALFRSSAFKRGETELVIIVTPYIVRPTDRKNLHTPLDNLRPAADGVSQMATGKLSGRARPFNGVNTRSGATFLLNR